MRKGFYRNKRFPIACLLAMSGGLLHAVPLANPDGYAANEDTAMFVDAANGLLANDTADAGPLTAILVSDVATGNLALQDDGSFTFLPSPDFHGTNTFTYKVSEVPADQIFTIDSSRSRLTINASLSTTFGSDSDSDASDVAGTLTVALEPSASPLSTLQITDIQATLTEAISLNFSFALAGVTVTGQPNALAITMDQAGPASAVAANGDFLQTNNATRVAGTINVNATGLADGQITEGDQALDVQAVLDFDGQVTQAGSTLTLTTPIVFNGTFDVSGNTVVLGMTGTLVATSPVKLPAESAPAIVTLVTDPIPDPPQPATDRYFLASNGELVIPALLSGGGSETLVPENANWRYLDDGSDQGTNWYQVSFDDAAWTNGVAQLGYGDGDEQTVIGFGSSTNKFITSYFRHRFTVADASRQGNLVCRVLRDDGVAIYLNGVEVIRNNLIEQAAFNTRASSAIDVVSEDNFFYYAIKPELLKNGENVIAAEVHQVLPTSSDLSFQLELVRENRSGGVLANDLDRDGDALTASLHRQAAHGVAVVNADGSFSYRPNPGFVGVDTFVYQAEDQDNRTLQPIFFAGSEWAYLDDGSDQGTNWIAEAFDDSIWPRGLAELGYGDPDHTTVVGFVDTTPGDPTNITKNATTYFRRTFYVGNAGVLENPYVLLLRDDAAAIFINGVEIHRDANLVPNAVYNTYAASGVANEDAVVLIPFAATRLNDGLNTIAVEVHQSSPTSSDMAFNLELGASLEPDTPLISTGHRWKFLPDGSNQGDAWRFAAYDDERWLSGPSKLGYGDGDEATTVPNGGATHPLTVYFRSTFEIADVDQIQTLGFQLQRDDGAAVYINGIEVARDNLIPDAVYTNPASATTANIDELRLFSFGNIDPSVLVDGTNTIAVEVHQVSATSSDLAMDLRLQSSMVASLGTVVVQVFDGGGFLDRDQDTMDDHWESANALNITVNDASLDADLDGANNGDEYRAGTNPQNPNSVFHVVIGSGPSETILFRFPSVPGKTYHLQHTEALDQPFVDLPGGRVVAVDNETTLPVLQSGLRRYVRVTLRPDTP